MKNLQTKWRQLLAGSRQALTTRTARVGGYSFLLGLIVLAILVAVNVLAGALPSRFTPFDISAAQLYSLTRDTKVVATNLDPEAAGPLFRSDRSYHGGEKRPRHLPHLCQAVYR